MGKYKIVAYYQTGDSFGSRDTQSDVELQWNDLEIAKENLRRIKEHDEFQREVDNRFANKTKDQLLKEAKNKPWFTDNKYGFYHCLNLLTDRGKLHKYSAPWCGYFERLHGARIELVDELDSDDMRFGDIPD
jgi:hypothetical protein